MSDAFDLLATAASEEVDAAGFTFRVRRVTHREMLSVRAFQLLLVGIPSADRRGVAETVATLVTQGGETGPMQALEFVEHALRAMAADVQTDAMEAKAEELRAAILPAGVTHYRIAAMGAPEDLAYRPAGPWRPCRIVLDGDAQKGDGTTPDVLPVRCLPGGGGTEERLCSAILAMSGCGPREAARMARFRVASGPGATSAPDGQDVRPPAE